MRWGLLSFILCCVAVSTTACQQSRLPGAMSDQEFWRLSEALSEPAGTFSLSDNLVSNEPHVAENARQLSATGGVYIGVGPEQNFTYIARLRPAMAFIVDIRRENRNLHLLYKALFDLSNDRIEFVSRLFSRPRAPDLETGASVDEIFSRYDAIRPSADEYRTNLTRVREQLVTTRRFPLSRGDLDSIERAYSAFFSDGPEINFWGSRNVEGLRPSYRRLMTAQDATRRSRSFLATEEAFRFVRDLQTRNMIVPVIGDFGGASAVQRVGAFVRERGDVIHAFYGSNVGVYLTNDQMRAFCRNLASLPAARGAWFIERDGVVSMSARLKKCAAGGM